MKSKLSLYLLVVFCGWQIGINSVHAQLTQEWSYDISTLGWYAYIDNPVIVDDTGNVYVLSYAGERLSGARVTKIRPDSTIAWQVSYPDSGLYLNYFGRSPAGDFFVSGYHEDESGVSASAAGIKFNADGTLAWGQTISAVQAPYSAYPRAAVDIDGNLWIGFTETPVDSFCIDSLPSGWGSYGGSGVISHAVVYRLDGQSGAPALVERIVGEDRQPVSLFSVNADNEGFVDVGIQTIEFCCNSLCQNCRDTCFTEANGSLDYYRSIYSLHRYSTAGGSTVPTWLSSSDDVIYSAKIFSGRNGELLVFRHQYMSPQPYWSHISRFGHWSTTLSGETNWGHPYEPTTDYSGNVLMNHWLTSTKSTNDPGYEVVLLDGATGSVRWTIPGVSGCLGADQDGNIYIRSSTNTVRKFDPAGVEKWVYTTGVDVGSVLHADTAGWFYFENYTTLRRYREAKYVTIRDGRRDSIPNVEFDFIRVANDPPYFSEDTIGTFTTDSLGQLKMTAIAVDSFLVELDPNTDTLVVGDSLKISKHVYSQPAVKHEGVLGTMYSIYLDNAQFAEDGHMWFDTVTRSSQDIILNHTELRYDLVVSVEWEATDSYLWVLENNIMMMSDYLYDVTDGQLRLDTVVIFDNGAFSSEADVLIMASNMQWPQADAGGLHSAGPQYLYMPRIWAGDSTRTRNYTDANYPLDLTWSSMDYRTKAHEFGHYAVGFYDEYLFWNPDSNLYSPGDRFRCLPVNVFRYGFMDAQYESAGMMSSEMSNGFRYEMAACQNTNQYRVHGKSCWDYLESQIESVLWGPDSLYVPILKPDALDTLERVVSNPGVYFPGPNNDPANLDYDVSRLIEFPNTVTSQAAGYSDKHVTVHHSTGGGNADVQLLNDPNIATARIIEQGRTSDAAGAWVVGVKDAAYQILASKGNSLATVTPSRPLASDQYLTTGWLYGIAESGGSRVSRVGNTFSANSTEDSITIELNDIRGYYPLISEAILAADGVTYHITTVQAFSSDPSLELWPSYGGSFNYAFAGAGDGYTAAITDSSGKSGSFTLWAIDDSSKTFFVPNKYSAVDVDHDQPLIWLFGAEGQSEFKLDSANISLSDAIILSSPYPVIRTGLAEDAVQAGMTHCLSVYPDGPLVGSNEIVIRYDDADLKLGDQLMGDEASLAVYRWIDATTGWQAIGGTVDTAENAVYAPIDQTGVYAAFTTRIVTDVEDDEYGDILPYRFELSQNYPNPFNPVTTIEYAIPERSHVIIDVYNVLGRKVRTLVDEEKPAGIHTIEWDGNTDANRPAATGIYLYRFRAGDHVETKKMLLLK